MEPNKRWKVRPGYSFLNMALTRDPNSQDSQILGTAHDAPKHQFQLAHGST